MGPETVRLLHREFTVDDAEDAFRLNSNPEVMRYTGDSMPESVDAARKFIQAYPDFDEVGFGRWACILKETRTIIGFCGLKYLPELDLVDVGYRFLPNYWGQGLATEACAACLEFGFQEIGLTKIYGFVVPENLASVRVLEKAGMRFDAKVKYDGEDALRFIKHHADTAAQPGSVHDE